MSPASRRRPRYGRRGRHHCRRCPGRVAAVARSSCAVTVSTSRLASRRWRSACRRQAGRRFPGAREVRGRGAAAGGGGGGVWGGGGGGGGGGGRVGGGVGGGGGPAPPPPGGGGPR